MELADEGKKPLLLKGEQTEHRERERERACPSERDESTPPPPSKRKKMGVKMGEKTRLAHFKSFFFRDKHRCSRVSAPGHHVRQQLSRSLRASLKAREAPAGARSALRAGRESSKKEEQQRCRLRQHRRPQLLFLLFLLPTSSSSSSSTTNTATTSSSPSSPR